LDDIIPSSDFHDFPARISGAREAQTLSRIIIGGEDVLDINRQRLREAGAQANADEQGALKDELGRVLWFLMTGSDMPQEIRISIGRGVPDTGAQAAIASLYSLDSSNVCLEVGPDRIERFSPLAARLTRMLEAEQPPLRSSIVTSFSRDALSLIS
jgi:hypothetical protein